MRVLVTGGAGYIGSHTVQELRRRGHRTVIVDTLVTGHRSAAAGDFVPVDIADRAALARVMRERGIDGVVHFAAFSAAGESVEQPANYFRNNVAGTVALLDAMVDADVKRLVFSSSCSVYGQPERLPVTEDAPKRPESPYGESKLLCERMFAWYERPHGIRSVCLRYFNAAGSSLDGSLGDDVRPPTRLLPVALEAALGKRPHLTLNGTDYPTPDGTCVRDYVHVVDLADAHVRALDYLAQGGTTEAFNVGVGRGYSNREMIDTIKAATGVDFPVVEAPRRPGDPAAVYADSTRVRRALGWEPRHSVLPTLVRTAWAWRKAHPDGYPD
jgi:UDP-glucose 4-epimerase